MQRFFKALRKWLVIIISIAVMLFAAAIVMLNPSEVSVTLLLVEPVSLTLGVLMMCAFTTGLLLSLVLMGLASARTRYRIQRLERELGRRKKSEATQ